MATSLHWLASLLMDLGIAPGAEGADSLLLK